jgi:ketosteroid isomerase-like protein
MRNGGKRAFSLALALVLALGLAACGPGDGDMSPEEQQAAFESRAQADLAAITEVREQYIRAINDGDLERLAGYWTEDVTILPPEEPPVVGKLAVRAWYQGMFSQMDLNLDNRAEETTVFGDWGYERGTFSMSLAARTPEGLGEPRPFGEYKYMTVLKRDGGAWKVARNIWNSNAPEPVSAPPS